MATVAPPKTAATRIPVHISPAELTPHLRTPVAEGSFAYIYKVNIGGKTMAVKKFKEGSSLNTSTSAEDFDKEVQVLSALDHPSIIRY